MAKSETTDQEVLSNIEAYSHYPWGEIAKYKATKAFLSGIRERDDGFVFEYRESPERPPYLYVHGIDYQTKIDGLIEDEFVGEHAFWRALNGTAIKNFLRKYKSTAYIKNIHADKSIEIKEATKPRLKVLPDIIDKLITKYNDEAVVLFTHRATGVFREVERLDKSHYQVERLDYKAKCTFVTTKFNQNHKIDFLTLLVITQAKPTR